MGAQGDPARTRRRGCCCEIFVDFEGYQRTAVHACCPSHGTRSEAPGGRP